MTQTVLKMEGINKSFGDAKVLKNVDFELQKGEVHALVGGNGAGKSTLMKIMTGVYTLDTGKIFVNGEEVTISKPADAKNKGIGMIFQELSLVNTLSITDNIFLGNDIVKKGIRDKKQMKEKTRSVLNKLGIDLNPDTTVSELSVGMSQMVEIAKAISKDAKILVFDEPTAALSDSETKRLFEIIEQLKQEGVSIVYISHRMNEIMQIADRITILKDGEKVITKECKDMTLDMIISYMMGGSSGKGHSFEWVERDYDKEAADVLTVEHLKVNDKIDDISFSIKPGQILGLAGLMGSGRTEIMETLYGLRPKLAGKILLEGKEIHVKNTKAAVKTGFSLLPEDRRKQGLVLMHSIKDNVILPILERLVKSKIIKDEKKSKALVQENIKQLNVKCEGINQQIGLLSGGNQQKIVIAKCINSNPKVMMMDEPTAGVDIGAKGEIINIIRQYADQGHGVLFVSSELAEMMAVCDTIITIFDGKITGKLERRDIKTEEELQNAIQQSK